MYAAVNGLDMYYEIHGSGRPIVLLHGGLSTIETSFGQIIDLLAQNRQVIAVELQGHGRTADIDRPLSYRQLADDIAAFLRHLDISADILGYSNGAGVAMQLAISHPLLVRKLAMVAPAYQPGGLRPGLTDAIADLTPAELAGTVYEETYAKVAPRPGDWPVLLEKTKAMDLSFAGWTAEQLQGIGSPTLVMIADSDIVLPEHAVEMFRLFGGGVDGDAAGLPKSRLAVLPGSTHMSIMDRATWLVPMVEEFLAA